MADMLCTTEDLATFMQKDLADLDSSVLTLLIEVSTAVIQAAVGGQRIIEVPNDTLTVLSTSDSWLDVPQIPVTDVQSVTLDGAVLTASQTDPNGYWWPAGNRIFRQCGWQTYPGVPSQTVIGCTHGYASGTQELQLGRGACLGLCRDEFVNVSGVQSESLDGYSVTYARVASALDGASALKAALRRQYGRRAGLARVG